jgi:hypothetical protein
LQRGCKVRVNNKPYKVGKKKMRTTPPHLVRTEGIALSRSGSWIEVLSVDEKGLLSNCWYPEETLDIIEPPVDL